MVARDEILFEPNRFVLNNGQELAARAFFDHLLLTAAFVWATAGRKRSATKLRPKYDYIVVGGGTSGSVVASRLSEDPSVSVLVLEVGGSTSEASHIPRMHFQLASHTTPLIREYLSEPQSQTCGRRSDGRCVMKVGNVIGGTASINAMMWVRGNRLDFDGWSNDFGLRNWSYTDLLPYFKKIEDNQEIHSDKYHDRGGPVKVTTKIWSGTQVLLQRFLNAAQELGLPIGDYNGKRQATFYPLQQSVYRGMRQSPDVTYIQPAETRPNLDIVMFAKVTRILLDSNLRTVGVEFYRDKKRHVVHVNREVILSAGAIVTPQILMLSGIGPADHLRKRDVKPLVDLPGVGQNFHDHTRCEINYTTTLPFPKDGEISQKSLDELRAYGTGVLSSNMAGEGHIRTRNSVTPDDVLGQLGLGYEVTEDAVTKERFFFIRAFAWSLKPRSRGYVGLRSADPFDDPIIDPRYLTEEFDRENFYETLLGVMKTMQTRPFRGKIRLDLQQ